MGTRDVRRRTTSARRIGLPAAIAAVAIAAAVSVSGAPASRAAPNLNAGPNVVVVMSDDQTLESLRVMPHVLGEIGARGATFDNFFVNFSQCCPSRSTFLTGDYAHNHHVMGNEPPGGGFERFEALNGENDLPLWMQEAGYYTGQVGKYLNGYGNKNPTLIPPGWNELYAVSRSIKYYNYELNENGTLHAYGSDPIDYLDRVITGKATDFIDRRAPARRPFFLYVAYKSPHVGGPHPSGDRCQVGPEPQLRHFREFDQEPLPEGPAFNEADVSDKPAAIQKLPPLSDRQVADIRTRYQCELEALQGVDAGVAHIIAALQRAQELRNTLVIFESDNGLLHGEHRLAGGKVRLYEPSIHVPLLMRGPGIPAGTHVRDLATNADIAPTILAYAHGRARRREDGESLVPAIAAPNHESGRRLLVESKAYDAVRTERYIYAEHRSGEVELYDLGVDPDELQNFAGSPQYADAQAALAADLAELRHCTGSSCRTPPALAVRLTYDAGASQSGHRCAQHPIQARITGADVGVLRVADLRVNGGPDHPIGPPYELTLPPSEVRRSQRNRVEAVLTLADGRRLQLERAFPRAC